MAGLFDDLIPGAKPGAAGGGMFGDLIPAKPKPAGFLRSVADLGIEAASGVARGLKFTADAFGADNAVSRGADTVDKFAREYLSAAAKADDQRVSDIMAAAQDAGVWEQVKAAAEAFTVKPVGMAMNALGTSVPTIATALIPGVAQAGVAARLGALGAMGAAQGAGVVKGSIYEAVKAEQIKAGASEADAEAAAKKAQEYGGENTANIAGGGVLGVAAGTTGVQPAIVRALQRGGQQAAQVGARGILERTLNPEGLLARTGMGALKEAPLEAAQGGQEQYASNIALQNEGFDTPAFRGVAGSAALEGLASAGPGAAFGALEKPGARGKAPKNQSAGELEAAIDAHEDLYADAVAEPSKPGSQEVIAHHLSLKQRLKEIQSKPPGTKKPGVVDVLAAPSVDGAINTAMQAVSVTTAPAVRPRQANADAAAELAMLDPADRAEALSLMQVSERQDISGNVRRYAQNRLDALLAPIRSIPTGEATEMLPAPDARELTDEERAEYANAAPFSYRRAMERGLPQPEVSEPIPAGDALELEDIPAGESTELDVETIQPTDLMAKDGEPFASKTGAQAKAYASGGGKVVTVPDHFGSGVPGYVVRPLVQVRPNNTRGTNADDVARSDGQRPADAGRGERAGVLRDSGPGDVLPSPAGAAGQGVAGPGAAGGAAGRTTDALTTPAGAGMFLVVGGQRYPVANFQEASEKARAASEEAKKRNGGKDVFIGNLPIEDAQGNVIAHRGVTDMIIKGPPVQDGAPPRDKVLYDPVDAIVAGMKAKNDARTVEAEPVAPKLPAPSTAVADPKANAPYYVRQPGTGKQIPVPSPEAAAQALGELAARTGAKPVDGSIDVYDAQTGLPAFNIRPDGTVKKVETADEARERTRRMIADEKRTVDAAPDALTGARRDLRGAMEAIDRWNNEWNALYSEGVAYFTGDGKARKLADSAPPAIKERYARLKKQKGTLQSAYDDASARVTALTPAAAPRPAPAAVETPVAPAPDAAKPRQLNGSDADKAAPLFQTEKQRSAPAFTEGQRVTLSGKSYTVKQAKPSAVILTRTNEDGGTESRSVKAGTDNWKAIQPEAAPAAAPKGTNAEQRLRQAMVNQSLYDEDPVAYMEANVNAAESVLGEEGVEVTYDPPTGEARLWRDDDEIQPDDLTAAQRKAFDLYMKAQEAYSDAESGYQPEFFGNPTQEPNEAARPQAQAAAGESAAPAAAPAPAAPAVVPGARAGAVEADGVKATSTPELQAYMAASAEVTRLETALIDLRSDTRIKPKGRDEWLRKIGALERELAAAKAERTRAGSAMRATPNAEAPVQAASTSGAAAPVAPAPSEPGVSTAEQVATAQELLSGVPSGEHVSEEDRKAAEQALGIYSLNALADHELRRMLSVLEVNKADTAKVLAMSPRPRSINDIADALGALAGAATKKAEYERAFKRAADLAPTNEAVATALNVYTVEKLQLESIAKERGLYGVKWAERNVGQRWTTQSIKVRKAKDRVVEAVRAVPERTPKAQAVKEALAGRKGEWRPSAAEVAKVVADVTPYNKQYTGTEGNRQKARILKGLEGLGLKPREAQSVLDRAMTTEAQRRLTTMRFILAGDVRDAAEALGYTRSADAPAKREEYPLGKTDREDRFFGTRVRVLPELKGDTAWEGVIQSTLNGGRLFTVKRGDSDARPRIGGDRLEILEIKDAEKADTKPKEPTKAPASFNMLPLPERWDALVAHTKQDGGDPDKGQRSYRALTQFIGSTEEKPSEVWDRWSSIIGSTELVNMTGPQVLKWMESNLPTNLSGYERGLPSATLSTNAGDASYWQKAAAALQGREKDHNNYVDRLEKQTRDVEELGGDADKVAAARKEIEGIKRAFGRTAGSVQQGLAMAERREKEEAEKRAADEAAKYKPFDAKELSKKPTPASMSGWFTATYEGKTVWTQGTILDLSGEPPHLAGYEGRRNPERNKDGKLDVARVIPRERGPEATPFGFYDGPYSTTAKNGVVYFDADGRLVGADATLFRYFASKFKGATYFASPSADVITVRQAGKTVGVLMPIKLGSSAQPAPSVTEIRAKIAAKPAPAQQPEAAEPTEEAADQPEAEAKAPTDRRRKAAEYVRQAVTKRTNANSAMVWQIIGPDGNPVSGPPGKYPGNDGPLAGSATMGNLGWGTKRDAEAALAELNRKADEILGAAAPAPQPVAEPAAEATAEPNALTQTFQQWTEALLDSSEYKARFMEAAGGDRDKARILAANGDTDTDNMRRSEDIARTRYWRELMDAPRDAVMSLEAWDALPPNQQVDAQRHFFGLEKRIDERQQQQLGKRVDAENAKKAPYEAALAEVEAEIRRLDKAPGLPTKKQNDLSMRRERLREAIYQIGQGKEPDGRLLRKEAAEPAAVQAAAEATALTLDAIPKSLQITLELEGEDGKTQKKLVNARKAFLAATQRVEKLRGLANCLKGG